MIIMRFAFLRITTFRFHTCFMNVLNTSKRGFIQYPPSFEPSEHWSESVSFEFNKSSPHEIRLGKP